MTEKEKRCQDSQFLQRLQIYNFFTVNISITIS